MQVEEMFAPSPEIAAHPAVGIAAGFARDVLEPHAAAADDPARGVDPDQLAALARLGLMSVKVPDADGGLGGSDAVDAEVVELLAGACTATWFVITQHRMAQNLARGLPADLPAGAAALGPAAAGFRDELCRASLRAGIAITHTRRPGPPAIRAEPDGRGGYVLTGRADWCTGWGMIDVLLVAAATPDDRFVFTLLPARPRPGLWAGPVLPLAVMGGTRTVTLELDGLAASGDEVALVVDAPVWRRWDLARTTNATPASLGLLRRVLAGLERTGLDRDRPEAVELAVALAEPAVKLRSEAYALLTEVPTMERIAERAAVRAEITELLVRAANAAVVAQAGRAILLTSPEQRWAREAMLHLVQAQTGDVRSAQLRTFARG